MSLEASESFERPRWMVNANLAASLLFAVVGGLYLATGRGFLGIVWLAIGGFWLYRYRWARASPVLEVSEDSLAVHLGPGRQRALALSEIVAVAATDERVELELRDGSTLPFSKSDLAPDGLRRLAAVLESRCPPRRAGDRSG